MKGLVLAGIYSLKCPEIQALQLEEYLLPVIRERNPDFGELSRARFVLSQIQPFFFYQLIALKAGIEDCFEQEVVRAYWLGQGLSSDSVVQKGDIERVVRERRIPWKEDMLEDFLMTKANLLIGGLPYHNFDVLLPLKQVVGRRAIPSHLLYGFNECLVRSGRISEKKSKDTFVVETFGFSQPEPREVELEEEEQEVKIDSEITKRKPRIGDYVSFHLGFVREIISKRKSERIRKLTKDALCFIKGRS